MSHVWTTEDVLQLIAEVENMREVWDHSSLDYKNKAKRRTSLQNLGDKFGTNCNEIVRKLHNLRTQLNNEYRRMKQKRLEGDRSYVSNWAYFDSIKYMLGAGKLIDMNNLEFQHVEIEMNPSQPQRSDPLDETNKPEHAFIPKKLKIEPETITKTIPNANNPLIQKTVTNSKDDETFGLFVTSALRNLRSDQCKRKMKRLIQKVILEVEEEDDILSDNL